MSNEIIQGKYFSLIQNSILILFLSAISLGMYAQEGNVAATLKGKVMDNKGNAVAYTNIGLEGTYYGTASNIEGEFELKIPKEFSDKRILFSAIGFKNTIFQVSDLFGKEFNLIKMEEKSYSIEDIDINAQSKVLFRILRTASENIQKNFLAGSFYLDCSYSWEKIKAGKVKTREAKVELADKTGYTKPSKLDAYKNRYYKFSNVKKNFENYSLLDGTTNMDEIINLDFARSLSSALNPELSNTFELTMEEEPVYKDISTWLIGFKQNNPTFEGTGDFYASQFEGKIYINKNNYAVMRIECWLSSPKQNRLDRGLAIAPGNTHFITEIDYDFSVNYNSKGVEFISINKNYKEGGIPVKETTKLVANSLSANSENNITSRDYFEGE